MDRIILLSHVCAGFLALFVGLSLGTFIPKGNRLHRKLGKLFFYAMTWVFISALLIVIFIRFNLFLTLIAFFSFYMTFIGYRVLKRGNKNPSILDKTVAVFTFLWGAIVLIYGLIIFFKQGFSPFVFLCTFFSGFTINTVLKEVNSWRKSTDITPKEIILYHLQSMMGALIASITAFAVQIGVQWVDLGTYSWLLWILPSFALTPLIIFWSVRISKSM
jgi:uncharacterized membrane protein